MSRLGGLLRAAIERGVVTSRLALTRLDGDVLVAAGLATDKSALFKQLTRVSTRLHYTQSKYNLMAEEGEGYAKLVTEAFHPLPREPAAAAAHVAALRTRVQALVGTFALDPNRVFDVLLDAAEAHGAPPAFLALFDASGGGAGGGGSMFSAANLAQLLGFKFSQLAPPPPTPADDGTYPPPPPPAEDTATPPSLTRLAAALVARGAVDLRTLWCHLTPPPAVTKSRAGALAAADRGAADECTADSRLTGGGCGRSCRAGRHVPSRPQCRGGGGHRHVRGAPSGGAGGGH